jgi:putative addiction module component (TIGR02574 family)
MTVSESILSQVLQLSPSERFDLAHQILDTIPDDDAEWELISDAQLAQELERRMEDHESGRSHSYSLDEAVGELRQVLQDGPQNDAAH